MELTSQRIDGANAKLTAVILQEEVNKNVDKIAKELGKTANIAGFRKGKVPTAVIKKTYGEKLVQDGEAEALRDLLNKGLKELDIDNSKLIGEPQIVKFDKNDDKIDVEVELAIRPEIDLGDYFALVPEITEEVASDEEIDQRVQDLAKAQTSFVTVEEDRAVDNGDMAILDFKGYIDGEELKGGSAEDFNLSIGSGQFIPGFEDGVIGMKVNEEKKLELKFPDEYQNPEIAGKDVIFDVKLKEIQTKGEVVIDDELAKKVMPEDKEATVESLKEKTKADIESEKASKKYNEEYKPQLVEALLENVNFDLPNLVVEQEIDMAVNKRASSMSEDEINEIKSDRSKLDTLRDEERQEARKSVKATFIVDALAIAEGVSVKEEEVTQTIYYEALMTGKDPEKMLKDYTEAGYLPAVQMAMVEDRVLS